MPTTGTYHGVNIDAARGAAERVVETHRRIADWLKEGRTLPETDRFVADTLEELDCRSCFLGYRVGRLPAFPSHACLSLNDCIVHGTAGMVERALVSGDILSVDIGVWYRGWIGDAAWTYAIRERSEQAERLMEAGKESLRRGVQQISPGTPLIEWARAVQTCVESERGFHLVRGLGGHGIGRKLHGPPFVSNVVPTFPGEWADGLRNWTPGTLVAVEPMLAIGTGDTLQRPRQWPVFTADGSLSVHYEHDILVTDTGTDVLTAGLGNLPDIVG